MALFFRRPLVVVIFTGGGSFLFRFIGHLFAEDFGESFAQFVERVRFVRCASNSFDVIASSSLFKFCKCFNLLFLLAVGGLLAVRQ
ncbi:MAG: hypothetical protein K2O94_03990 [Clostridiales bacterium]|nr:hypothetical protein [Clostridiales bacterium]